MNRIKIHHMKFTLHQFLLIAFILFVSSHVTGQDYFSTELDTTKFKTDTVFKKESVVITYIDLETYNELVVSFETEPEMRPNGYCIYRESTGLTVEGNYKSGEMTGVWTEKNEDGSVLRKVNYDFKETTILKDSLIFQEIRKSENEYYVIQMPSFEGGELPMYVRKNKFIPASYRFFHKKDKPGRAYIQFNIVQHKYVANVNHVGPEAPTDLIKEGKRLIYSTNGRWFKSLSRGKLYDITYTLPVIFSEE